MEVIVACYSETRGAGGGVVVVKKLIKGAARTSLTYPFHFHGLPRTARTCSSRVTGSSTTPSRGPCVGG